MSPRLHRLADAVLLPGFVGTEPPDWVRARVAGGLGGVVLFARNVRSADQLAALTAALRAERGDVLVAVDEEGGDVTRLDAAAGSSVPGPLALGMVDDVAVSRAVGHALGRRLVAAGITVDLAPVADVNSNPDNPVIGVRSFGADPALVARHVGAAVDGLQAAGVAACAKHFPGHGDTAVDSHLGLPTVAGELAGALLPFRAAVAAGVRAVMTGHLLVPGYDPVPATLNPALIDGLLRGELGFRGVVISDGIEMGAVAGTVGLAESAVQALLAGVDAICVGGGLADEDTVLLLRAALVDAVRTGRLPEQRLADAADRLAGLAGWAAEARGRTGRARSGDGDSGDGEPGHGAPAHGDPAHGDPGHGDPGHGEPGHGEPGHGEPGHGEPGHGDPGHGDPGHGGAGDGDSGDEPPEAAAGRVGLAAARRAVRAWGTVRLPAEAEPVLVELDPVPNIAVGRTGWGLSTVLPARLPGTSVLRVGPDDPAPDPPAGRPLVVVTRDAARLPWQRAVLAGLLAGRPDAVVVEMGLAAAAPPPAAGYVETYSASRASAVAVAEMLLGFPG